MNVLIENGEITEIKCGDDFSYLFTDNADYSESRDRAAHSEAGEALVPFMKIRCNGQIGLHYLTGGLVSLEDARDEADAEGFLSLAADLLASIVRIRENGFLSARGIECSPERIYADVISGRVKLVYLPADIDFYKSEMQFEDALKKMLYLMIDRSRWKEFPAVVKFSDMLCDKGIELSEIFSVISPFKKDLPGKKATGGTGLRLTGVSGSSDVITVNKDCFVIGKKAGMADGLVTDNRLVSRVHCRIVRKDDGSFVVTDLDSMNGTYVNNERLIGEECVSLKDGDILRLANSDFRVEMGDFG